MDLKTQYSTILDNKVQIEIGTDYGWFKLVNDMLNELEKLKEPLKIHLIKEKFGSLRVYSYSVTNNQTNVIKKYQKIASVTCERCGNIGSYRTNLHQCYDNGVYCANCATKLNFIESHYRSDDESNEQ